MHHQIEMHKSPHFNLMMHIRIAVPISAAKLQFAI